MSTRIQQIVKPLWPFMIASVLTFAGVAKLQSAAVNSGSSLLLPPIASGLVHMSRCFEECEAVSLPGQQRSWAGIGTES
jgi:hypothetical protein